MQSPELIHIKTKDGPVLPGLLYKAAPGKKIAIHLHGNGSSSVFYYDDQRDEQVNTLNKKGISFFLFNNRGANYIKKLDVIKRGKRGRKRFGMAYEEIKDCIKDIDGVINHLGKLGYREFYLVGESTGASKIAVYHYYKKSNKVSKYILLGAGDDTGIYYDMLGKKRFFKLLKESKEKIKKGEGEDIIKELLPDMIFSYIGFYDVANPDGDYNTFPFLESMTNLKLSKKRLFRHFKSINKPTLVVYGEEDEYAWGDVSRVVDILKEQKPEFDYRIIKGADHGFSQHQKELSQVMSKWLI